MNNIILPFLMSMLLGRTIDLTTYDIGGSVFDDADYDETPATSLNTTYHVMQDEIFSYTYFGIPADIVLRIKSGHLSSSSGAMGLDGLLKDTSWRQNSVLVGTTTIYRTMDRSLKKDAIPINDWKERISKAQTHYAQSLFYGGWCVVLFRFQCDIPGDVQIVRKTLTETLGVVGELNWDTIDLWNKGVKAIVANHDIRGLVKVTPYIYSTVSLQNDITTPESLMTVIENLPNITGPVGQPLFMNLLPLHDLDKEFPEVKEQEKMLGELEKLDAMLDDVSTTKDNLMRWITDTLTIFEDEEEDRISNLLNTINDCIRAFSKVSSEVSLFKNMDQDALESAFHTYLNGLEKGMGTYNLAYRKMKEDIDAECENEFLHKIRGLLRVYENEQVKKGSVSGGLTECQQLCLKDSKCRAIGFADEITQLDLNTGLYVKLVNQCWIYFRSTSTSVVYTPSGIYGNMYIYDRDCYF